MGEQEPHLVAVARDRAVVEQHRRSLGAAAFPGNEGPRATRAVRLPPAAHEEATRPSTSITCDPRTLTVPSAAGAAGWPSTSSRGLPTGAPTLAVSDGGAFSRST